MNDASGNPIEVHDRVLLMNEGQSGGLAGRVVTLDYAKQEVTVVTSQDVSPLHEPRPYGINVTAHPSWLLVLK